MEYVKPSHAAVYSACQNIQGELKEFIADIKQEPTTRTNLEEYLKATIQMLLARLDNEDEDPILDKLDVLWEKLSREEIEFVRFRA